MFLKLLIFSFLFYLYSGLNLNLKDYCRLIQTEDVGLYDRNNKYEVVQRLEKCSTRNTPHIYECDENICSKNEDECNKYLSLKKKIKANMLKVFSELFIFLNPKKHSHNHIKLERYFLSFKSSIKNCTRKPYQLKLSDVCLRGRNCFQIIETSWIKKLFSKRITDSIKQIYCPCHGNHKFICGNESNYCSINKEACDSFVYKNYFEHLKANQQQPGVHRCDIEI